MALARTNRGTKTLAYATQATATLTSNAFTPAVGALVVVMFTEVTTDSAPTLSLSVSGFTTGSWSTVSSTVTSDGFGSYFVTRIASAVVATSASGSVTCTRRAGTTMSGMFVEFVEVTGQATTPIAQSVTNVVATSSAMALNFATAPDAASFLFTVGLDCDASAGTQPSGFTALGTATIGFSPKHAERLGSGAKNNQWTGLDNFYSAGVLIEVAELGQFSIGRRPTYTITRR